MKKLLLTFLIPLNIFASDLQIPTFNSDLEYSNPILDGNYIQTITKPDTILGFEVGTRVATPLQITNSLMKWADESNRLQIVEYARSHEDRPLFAVYISTPENLANLETIESNILLLSDSRKINDRQAKEIVDSLPAVAWMSYSIHGNETSGADAALASIYHLIASEDKDVLEMLDNMIVIIDPLMNPDGRDRFAKSLEQYRGTAPNVDDQSLLHSGDWPYGRTNHYFFDLNRDFYFLTQPETKGRVALINKWRPQLMIDGHEMGPQDTFLMGPPREPINKNIDLDIKKWGDVFAEDQAKAFDDRDWRYYTGEWFENLYPGYSNYSEYRGSVHILYEQSRMAEDGVRRPEGTVQTYKESVHHMYISTMANLKTLQLNSKEMYKDYWDGRKYNVSSQSEYANKYYVILPTDNLGRLNTFISKLEAQEIEIYTNTNPIKVSNIINQIGDTEEEYIIPEGSLIVPNRQPDAPLIAAILEFDAKINDSVLIEERQKVLKNGSSVMYDATAWNLTMMYGLPAITINQPIREDLVYWENKNIIEILNNDAIGWSVNGNDDRSVAFAARLMEQNINVRILDKETKFLDQVLTRGSIFVTKVDNPKNDKLLSIINSTLLGLNISASSVLTGYGKGDLPDWGGEHFRLLTKPQIALLGQSNFNSYDVGSSWWTLDKNLGIRHSQINSSFITYADLRRYNTIIMPDGNRVLSENEIEVLNDWIKQGGTLIAHDNSSSIIASKNGLGSVTKIQDSLDKSIDFDIDLQREWLADKDNIDFDQVNSNTLNYKTDYPWDMDKRTITDEELIRRDNWQSKFMPSGAFVVGRVDNTHWLSFGTPDVLPILYSKQPVLMTSNRAEAVVRIGSIEPNNGSEIKQLNWSTIPADHDIKVRISGLVWPEASEKIANSAYLTREQIGNGQLILFSGQPNFRGSTRGTSRLWLNAVVYGAGLGTTPRINL
ncbi:MAG: peptidase [SAR86 cluster bacterium]|uniref:Peptidase n=1 Tax=SAR86 cluster bacterium TaxID=2030880 RepID=A0A520MSU0_9GAMM|nr:MAG: peptidase [SAR86 cluster bacterium]